MRGLVAATAVLGAIATAGLPALALTLADDETGTRVPHAATVRQPGPPPWAHGHHQDGKPKKDKAEDGSEETDEDAGGPPGWARQGHDVPPGWAKHHAGAAPHGWAVREWAHCVADAAAHLAEGEKLDAAAACGEKPEHPLGPQR